MPWNINVVRDVAVPCWRVEESWIDKWLTEPIWHRVTVFHGSNNQKRAGEYADFLRRQVFERNPEAVWDEAIGRASQVASAERRIKELKLDQIGGDL